MRPARSGVRLLVELVLEPLGFGGIEVGQHGGGRASDRPAVGFEPAAAATSEAIPRLGLRYGLVAADGILGAHHRVVLRRAEVGVDARRGGGVARQRGLHDEGARHFLPLGTRQPFGERQSRRATGAQSLRGCGGAGGTVSAAAQRRGAE